MKSLKKIGVLLFAVCFLMLYPSVSVHAAEGTLQFSDPTAKVGEDVTVKAKISTGGEAIGDGFVTVTYDKAALEFVSGTNATGGDGTVKLEATGDGTASELEYTMVFKALQEGATKLEVSEYTSYLYSDETLNLTTGDSTVTVEAGDGTSSESSAGTTAVATGTGSVEIDGVTYTIYNDFSDALVPDGCSRTTIEYNGETVNAILQETSGKCFVYLVEGDKDPVMALYNEKDNSFAITEMVSITDSSYIFLLGTNDGKGLPSQFKKTKLTVGTLTFPVWQNSESEDFYLMYAMNESGEESFYQYDTKDETYQRYPVTDVKEKSTSSSTTLIDKVKNFLQDQVLIVVAAAWAVILILIIIIIVVGVKLRRRNEELDEFYDEHESIGNSKGSRAVVEKKSRKQFKGYQDEEDDFVDDFEDEEETDDEDPDEYEEYEDDDEYGEDDYDAYEDDSDEYEDDFEEYDDDEYEDDDYDDEYDEYEDYDDDEEEDDVPEYQPKRRSSAREEKDSYDVDFIDL